ncbi:unnamed protein product [marine sediment metagenome]|uniref:Uncharacterized protein n=1 Tax=marine sediment metagenome TaxID=412755 RepID=X0UJA9_9ZZZZ
MQGILATDTLLEYVISKRSVSWLHKATEAIAADPSKISAKILSYDTAVLFTPLNIYPVKCEAYLNGAELI